MTDVISKVGEYVLGDGGKGVVDGFCHNGTAAHGYVELGSGNKVWALWIVASGQFVNCPGNRNWRIVPARKRVWINAVDRVTTFTVDDADEYRLVDPAAEKEAWEILTEVAEYLGNYSSTKEQSREIKRALSLLAAAPDMLEALKGVLRVADRKTNEFDAARAAIAKAESA